MRPWRALNTTRNHSADLQSVARVRQLKVLANRDLRTQRLPVAADIPAPNDGVMAMGAKPCRSCQAPTALAGAICDRLCVPDLFPRVKLAQSTQIILPVNGATDILSSTHRPHHETCRGREIMLQTGLDVRIKNDIAWQPTARGSCWLGPICPEVPAQLSCYIKVMQLES